MKYEETTQAAPSVAEIVLAVKPKRTPTRKHPWQECIGKQFHWLTIVSHVSDSTYLCACQCGQKRNVRMSGLLVGDHKSCGCWRRKMQSDLARKHGHGGKHRSRTYTSWAKMVTRCTDTNGWAAKYYVGKGIKVCNQLREFDTFLDFMGERPEGASLDRRDSNKNYSCGQCEQCLAEGWELNVRWANRFTQSNNTSRNHFVEFNGERHTIGEWARKLGFDYDMLINRLRDGWTPERAFTTPVSMRRSHADPSSKRQRAIKSGINRRLL